MSYMGGIATGGVDPSRSNSQVISLLLRGLEHVNKHKMDRMFGIQSEL
jgi:hypothetical protein